MSAKNPLVHTPSEELGLKHMDTWSKLYKELVGIEIQYRFRAWGDDPSSMHAWTYYITICERFTDPKIFKSLWLKDKVSHFSIDPKSMGLLTHDYMGCSHFDDLDLKGGITFYEKHGHKTGYRSLKVGCDYMHSWDHGNTYLLNEVFRDAERSAELAIAQFGLSKSNVEFYIRK